MLARKAVSVLKHGLISTSTSRLIHSSGVLGTKVAVVLSGCGVYDGSEVHEASANVLLESARIARGKVEALSGLKAQNFDAVIFPGGFGAAKNLSTFATEGTAMSVDSDVERVLREFHTAAKPIGLCCIAPVLAAKVIPGCEVTVGSDQEEGGRFPYAGTAGAIEALGSRHIKKNVTECHVDSKNKIVTTPAFMCETAVHEIYDGIGTMIKSILGMAK